MFKKTVISSALAFMSISGQVIAQTAPDAGQILQQLTPPPAVPQESKPIRIETPGAATAVRPGGVEVVVQSFAFSGNTVFSSEQLKAVLGDATGKRYDLAGLRGLADQVVNFYRMHGYPFTRTFIPPQEFKDGVLTIQVLEGRYGSVHATDDKYLAAKAQPFLNALQPSQLIASDQLERSILILSDQPGIRVTPTLRPGQAVGSGDLDVLVERDTRYGGAVAVDNTGNRYTGELQARATLYANSPFMFGDRIVLNTLASNENLWLGSLDYDAPIGSSGLRGQVGYAYTHYELGKEFAYLDATGLARVWNARLSYPLVRSQQSNLLLSVVYQRKELEDRFRSINSAESRSSDTLPVILRFDHRDQLGGGGITYGAASWTAGSLHLDGALADADAATARKAGGFNKANLDIARIQKVTGNVSLYGRYSGQWADKNLDSSERFVLGGAYGVRAYPTGEALGDRGSLLQLELRYAAGLATPFVFYDAGRVSVNAKPWNDTSNAHRTLSGAGFGVRADYRGWNVDLALAWRITGGAPTEDVNRGQPRAWLTVGYRF